MSSESYEKFKELTRRVGNHEELFCGRCKRKTSQVVVRESRSGILETMYDFKSECDECGTRKLLLTY